MPKAASILGGVARVMQSPFRERPKPRPKGIDPRLVLGGIALPGAVGAGAGLYGAATAGEGRRLEGGARAGSRVYHGVRNSMIGAGVGALAGLAAGNDAGSKSVVPALIGAGIGGLGGGYLGDKAWQLTHGIPSWERDPALDEDQDPDLEKQSNALGAVAGLYGAGALGSGAYGAYNAPEGKRLEGFARGMSRYGNATAGMAAGGMLGAGLAGQAAGTDNAAILGGVAGAAAGGLGGDKLWKGLYGAPSWERQQQATLPHPDDEEPDPAIRDMEMNKLSGSKDRYNRKHRKSRLRYRTKRAEFAANAARLIAFVKAGGHRSYAQQAPIPYKTQVGPEVRTNKGKYQFTGRTAKHVHDDPTYNKYTRTG